MLSTGGLCNQKTQNSAAPSPASALSVDSALNPYLMHLESLRDKDLPIEGIRCGMTAADVFGPKHNLVSYHDLTPQTFRLLSSDDSAPLR